MSLAASPPVNSGHWTDYEWILVVGAIAAFFMAWGIGANDVANSFGTSVGSKTLKLWHAVIIAACMEFTGAMALGGEVTKTIAGSIADPNAFKEFPELFMYGMLCALLAAAIWILWATYMSLAVSTTHSIIGAIMGFALVWKGRNGVLWNQHVSVFPYSKGFVPVVCSWFVSPLAAGIVGGVLFAINRLVILRRKNSTEFAFWALPPLVFLTIFVNLQFVLYKGAKAELAWSSSHCAWVAAAAAAGAFVIAAAVGIPLMKRRHRQDMEAAANPPPPEEPKVVVDEEAESPFQARIRSMPDGPRRWCLELVQMVRMFFWRVWKQFVLGLTFDVHAGVEDDERVMKIHQNAEVFDPHTEQVYKYLQVFSACSVSFAHGSNDVANAIGPLSAIFYIYRNQKVASTVDAPKWIFALGGAGIVIGLATYGYNIIRALGVKLLKLTPSRGFSAELATALTVSVASRYGLPISTTQIIVGAETGVGLVDNWRHGINGPLLLKTFTGWVFTIIVAGLVCAAIFAQGVYAPSINNLIGIRQYRAVVNTYVTTTLDSINTKNLVWNQTGTRWWTAPAVGAPMTKNGSILNSTIVSTKNNLKNLLNFNSAIPYVLPETLLWYTQFAQQLHNNYSLLTIGQNPAGVVANTSGWAAP